MLELNIDSFLFSSAKAVILAIYTQTLRNSQGSRQTPVGRHKSWLGARPARAKRASPRAAAGPLLHSVTVSQKGGMPKNMLEALAGGWASREFVWSSSRPRYRGGGHSIGCAAAQWQRVARGGVRSRPDAWAPHLGGHRRTCAAEPLGPQVS